MAGSRRPRLIGSAPGYRHDGPMADPANATSWGAAVCIGRWSSKWEVCSDDLAEGSRVAVVRDMGPCGLQWCQGTVAMRLGEFVFVHEDGNTRIMRLLERLAHREAVTGAASQGQWCTLLQSFP
jgi:hypothetical protein